MNFDAWSLNESAEIEAKKLLTKIEKIVGDRYGKLFIVPDFETFERPGEPKQNSALIGSEKGPSIALNFADGKFYSADLWRKDQDEPEMTVYADGHDIDEFVEAMINSQKTDEKKDDDSDDFSITMYVEGEPGEEPEKLRVDETPKEKKEFDKEATKDLPVKLVPSVAKKPGTKSAELKSEYEYQDPDTIFDDLRFYTNLVIDGTQPSMLITGSPGIGKTFIVTDEIKKAGLKKGDDYYHAKGKATAAGMFQVLWEQNGKLIIFDDMDSIFKDDNAVNILKGALDSGEEREISWLSSRPLKTSDGSEIPPKFDFTGRVIFISNVAQKDVDSAIKTRSFVIEVALSPQDTVKYIQGILKFVMPYARMSVKENALKKIKELADKNPAVQVNMRTLIKAVKILNNVDDDTVAERLIIQQCSYK